MFIFPLNATESNKGSHLQKTHKGNALKQEKQNDALPQSGKLNFLSLKETQNPI